ncbi:MAG: Gfo/Idh/MocA family oxidoreductase [Chloroflexi bacterium]|nr:Gfo/Idh/MocA family oxidoreductase [Chloroflexota bacterium]
MSTVEQRSSSTLGWGIIGIGRHADARMAPAIQSAKGARLVAVCSRNEERARAFAETHGAAWFYTDLGMMLQNPAVEVVYIATPNALHAPQTLLAAAAGKHVLCEKPMALSVADAEAMVEACQRHNVRLGVCFQNRHHPAHQEMKRLLASGFAGDITLAVAQYSHGFGGGYFRGWRADVSLAGGGALMGSGLHPIDLLRFLLGKEIVEVWAASDGRLDEGLVDEMTIAILKFADGPFATVVSSIRVPRAHNDVVLYGTRARLEGIQTVGMPLQGEFRGEGEDVALQASFPSKVPTIENFVRQVENFTCSVRLQREPNASGLDGLEMVRVADAILQSARSGRSVRLRAPSSGGGQERG